MPVDTDLTNWNKENFWQHPLMPASAGTPMYGIGTSPPLSMDEAKKRSYNIDEEDTVAEQAAEIHLAAICKPDQNKLMDELLQFYSWLNSKQQESEVPMPNHAKQLVAPKGPHLIRHKTSTASLHSNESQSDSSDSEQGSPANSPTTSKVRVVLGELTNIVTEPQEHWQTRKKLFTEDEVNENEEHPVKRALLDEDDDDEDFWGKLDDICV